MEGKRLLVIGAGFLQAFLIGRAAELGCRVLAVDGDPGAPGFALADEHACVDIVDARACLAYARERAVDGVVTAATDFGVVSAALVASELGLPGPGLEAARLVKDKGLVRERLEGAGVEPPSRSAALGPSDAAAGLAGGLCYPVMVKPCDGSGSRGASRVDGPAALPGACDAARASSLSGRVLVEPFVEGREYGVESYVWGGVPRALCVMRKEMTEAPRYAELGHEAPSGLGAAEAAVAAHAERAIAALGIAQGAVNMDVIVSPDGAVHVVDVGLRMGGNLIGSHVVPLATGVDHMGNIVRGALGVPPVYPAGEARGAVATRLLALTPGRVLGLPDFAAVEEECGVEVLHHLSVGDAISEYRTNLDGCGYVVARGGDLGAARDRAREALRRVDAGIVRGEP